MTPASFTTWLAEMKSGDMKMKYIVRCKDGQRWKVRSATSLHNALSAIASAKVTGSVGSSTTLRDVDGCITVLADVVQVNSDGSERKPYTQAY